MKKTLLIFSLTTAVSFAAANDPRVRQVSEAMKKATEFFRSISTNGGYAGIYSPDLKKRYGEAVYEKAGKNEIWVQPPGTPTVGQVFLEAYYATGETYYLDAVGEVAKALVWGQRAIGGWDHRVNVSHLKKGSKIPERKNGWCTFDDKITQGAIEFLIDADAVLDEPWLTDGIRLGLEFMIKSQFDNGAWPQWYPLRGGYHDYYTFNDHAINDCIDLMLKAHKTYGNEEYLRSAVKGGRFIILSQGKSPQSGWAQQYSHDMKPAWARRFEPPGICSAVTVNNIRTLTRLYIYTEDKTFLAPIGPAIEWLNNSAIAPGKWARLYEPGTNRPVYGDRENGNKIIYDYSKVSQKEKSSYGWQGEYGIGSSIAFYNRVIKDGPTAWKRIFETQTKPDADPSAAARLEPAALKSAASLDEKGRWIEGGYIKSQTFVNNMRNLARYLAAAGK